MPIHFEIDTARRLLHFRVIGRWETPEMVSAITQALAGIAGEDGYDVLSDHREIGVPATPDQIREVVALMAAAPSMHGRRAAVVVSQPASYGMMRMLASHTASLGIDLRVFHAIEDALDFLRPGDTPR